MKFPFACVISLLVPVVITARLTVKNEGANDNKYIDFDGERVYQQQDDYSNNGYAYDIALISKGFNVEEKADHGRGLKKNKTTKTKKSSKDIGTDTSNDSATSKPQKDIATNTSNDAKKSSKDNGTKSSKDNDSGKENGIKSSKDVKGKYGKGGKSVGNGSKGKKSKKKKRKSKGVSSKSANLTKTTAPSQFPTESIITTNNALTIDVVKVIVEVTQDNPLNTEDLLTIEKDILTAAVLAAREGRRRKLLFSETFLVDGKPVTLSAVAIITDCDPPIQNVQCLEVVFKSDSFIKSDPFIKTMEQAIINAVLDGSLASDSGYDIKLVSIPSAVPSFVPSSIPSQKPSLSPSDTPSAVPTSVPTGMPSEVPSSEPSTLPSAVLSFVPSSIPSQKPSLSPSDTPSTVPSSVPTGMPSEVPSSEPSTLPSAVPSFVPSSIPSQKPSLSPSDVPSSVPSSVPIGMPSEVPSSEPSTLPSAVPSFVPSSIPSQKPSLSPSDVPSAFPSSVPTGMPSEIPSSEPSTLPSAVPSFVPSSIPSQKPSLSPSDIPSSVPSSVPTGMPSEIPSSEPSTLPSAVPSFVPSSIPSQKPSLSPSDTPSSFPSSVPTGMPSEVPSSEPSTLPSAVPSFAPSSIPSQKPSLSPSDVLSSVPSESKSPSDIPSAVPSESAVPSFSPSSIPSQSKFPSVSPSSIPSVSPSSAPSESQAPSGRPSGSPSSAPSEIPSSAPSASPSKSPSSAPGESPSSAGPIELIASDGAGNAVNDLFASSVAISGDIIVVGDGYNEPVYVFETGGSTQTKLTASPASTFGRSVAISGETIVVGAFGDDDKGTNSGSVYVFEKVDSTWIQKPKLTPSDGAAHDKFGKSVAISGETIVVGATGDDGNGSVNVFKNDGSISGFTWEYKLTASDGAVHDKFGESVAISEDTIVVGAPLDDDKGSKSGSAYVFQKIGSTWTETKLTPSDGAMFQQFGESVAISGDKIVVGSSSSGYVFEKVDSTWIQKHKLYPSDGAEFGPLVAISENTIVVGSQRDNTFAYVFKNDGSAWTETKLTTYGATVNAVAISGGKIVVGTYYFGLNFVPSTNEYVQCSEYGQSKCTCDHFGGCDVRCLEVGSCTNLDIICLQGTGCSTLCSAPNSCKGLTMYCPDNNGCRLQQCYGGGQICVGAKVICGEGTEQVDEFTCQPADICPCAYNDFECIFSGRCDFF